MILKDVSTILTDGETVYQKMLRALHNDYVHNLIAVYQLATNDDKENGRSWYPKMMQWCNDLAKDYDTTLSRVAGLLAALSPLKNPTRNQKITIESFANGRATGQMGVHLQRAQSVYDGHNPSNALLNANGHKPKTWHFYHAIVNPDNNFSFTLDIWMIRAMFGNASLEYKHYGYATTDAKYGILLAAAIEASDILGINPNDLQAITWVTFSRLHEQKQHDRVNDFTIDINGNNID